MSYVTQPSEGGRRTPPWTTTADPLASDGSAIGSDSITVCTIHNGNFPDPAYQRVTTTALALFNDAILRTAIDHRLPVIDLRAICTHPEDYANPIEPSSMGGEKIARAIAALAAGTDPLTSVVRIIAG